MSTRHVTGPNPGWWSLSCALILAALTAPGIARAQVWPKTVTVEASILTRMRPNRSGAESPVDQVTLIHRVSYANLDLTTQSEEWVLRRRVAETARLACEQLEKLYPHHSESIARCTRQAVADATPQIDAAIEAAEREARGE